MSKLFQILKSQNIWNIKNESIFPALVLHTAGGCLQHKTIVGQMFYIAFYSLDILTVSEYSKAHSFF